MRSKFLLLVFVLVPLLGGIAVTILSATATFNYRHPQGEILTVTRNGRVMKLPTEKVAQGLQPHAVASELSHDFGTMNPLTMGRHTFLIRNEGSGPLSIVQGPTTCKCTLSKVAQDEIPPGGQGEVTLDWNTGRDRLYSHEATIFTNDPQHEILRFRVHGNVRMQLATIPETLNFEDLRPDRPTTAEVVVYSQVWDAFELVDGRSTNGTISWTVEPVSIDDLKDATAAHRVKVTVPAGLPSGRLSERLQFTVRPVADDETTLDLEFEGKVPRRLAVMGEGVRSDGVIDLGQVNQGESRTRRVLLKVRDEDRELIATQIECKPDFVVANVLPYEGAAEDIGLSILEVKVPSSAPSCSYLGVPLGDLHIEFDHSRIPSLDLKIKFAVVGQERKGG